MIDQHHQQLARSHDQQCDGLLLEYSHCDRNAQLIHQAKSMPFPTRREDLEEYAKHQLVAHENSGVQEVAVHFFCICVMHLRKLLIKAAEAARYETPEGECEAVLLREP